MTGWWLHIVFCFASYPYVGLGDSIGWFVTGWNHQTSPHYSEHWLMIPGGSLGNIDIPNSSAWGWIFGSTAGKKGRRAFKNGTRNIPEPWRKGELGTFSDLPAVGLQSWAMFSLDTSLRLLILPLWHFSVYIYPTFRRKCPFKWPRSKGSDGQCSSTMIISTLAKFLQVCVYIYIYILYIYIYIYIRIYTPTFVHYEKKQRCQLYRHIWFAHVCSISKFVD